ncbi:hypothetical protein BJ912DRAFT_921530 [Pholiota molesta]|nr:hypothetical protein BJ912DRAFT_921460 [Pholiota molesta]KAF8200970.1 hypothetical protein BJ912DRAFT_921530 [Pholiota molesta]
MNQVIHKNVWGAVLTLLVYLLDMLQYWVRYEYIKQKNGGIEQQLREESNFQYWGEGEGATILRPNWAMPSTAGLKIVPFRPARQYPYPPHVWFTTFPASEFHNKGVIKSSKIRRFQRA